MRFFDNSDIISECFLYHRNANSHPCTVLQPTHGKQTNICVKQELHTHLLQNLIMKMQTILFKNIFHTQIRK